MFRVLLAKLKEAAFSVLPVTLLIFAVTLTPLVDLKVTESVAFLVCALFLLLGIALFNLGAELAMSPMGEQVGAGLTKANKPLVLLAVCFILGVCITIAEPDLSVLATQVKEAINETLLIACVGIGVGMFLLLSILRILLKTSLSYMLMYFYMFLFAMASLVVIGGNGGFLAVAFDSGGVTTGPITVPFIMALGVGVATTLGGRHSEENSFGLVALCSVGPVLAVLILGVAFSGELSYELPDYSFRLGGHILTTLLETMKEVGISLALLVFFFAVIQFLCLHLPKQKLMQIGVGLAYTFVGLVIFLTAVKIGFMPVGYQIGVSLADHPALLVILASLLGMVSVLAEPAIHVLTKQVEDVTEGSVSRRSMLVALSLGVGIALGLSILRIIFDFNILYYLIPGYLLSFALSFFVPKLYTAIAFDSGGVASGPLVSGCILPFAIGACAVLQGEGKVLTDAFGVVAMVAMAPLISIQLLGFRGVVATRIRKKNVMRRLLDAGDEQIIHFL
jgi:hypothetical protein